MISRGVPAEADVMKPNDMLVFSFPQQSPKGSLTVKEVRAMDQLKLWSIYAKHYCEHKPSITVYYRDSDFLDVGAWVYRNLDSVSGIAFLPESDHIYAQAPYEAITEDMYNILVKNMSAIDWESFREEEDTRDKVGEFACTSDRCEITSV